MTWHALSPVAKIAAHSDLREILAMQAKIKREQESMRVRPVSAEGRSGRDATISILGRKWENLERARMLWIDEYRKTETDQ